MHTQDGFAESQGSLQLPQRLLFPQAFTDAPVAGISNQTATPNPNAVQRPSAKRSQRGQTSASCTLCRRRKVKCDRSVPCGNCARAGAECVPSIPSKAPRGRQGGRKRRTDGELLERIAKLEALIENVGGDSDEQRTTPPRVNNIPTVGVTEGPSQATVSDGHDRLKGSSNDANGHRSQIPGLGLDRYLGSSFWVTLSEEINGIKDVLNGSSDDDDEAEGAQSPASSLSSSGRQQPPQASASGFVISTATPAEAIGSPTPHQLYNFCDIFLANVDPVFKILHAPSLRRYLQEGAAELDCSPGVRGLEALKLAISYAATLSMTDGECRRRIGEDRVVLLARYRTGIEQALAKADFVNTVEMSTLQALTIYLTSVRVKDTSRLTWTLISLAVRIAEAMGLHHENPSSSVRPFERELRRRLWWQLRILDSHAAEDRATSYLIHPNSFNTRLPLHINDEDLHVNSSEVIEERQSFTDMTFCLICQEIMDTVRRLNRVPVKELGRPQIDSQEKWTQRIDMVIHSQRRIEEKYLRHLNLAHPFHWGTRLVADVITAIMWLVVYRPLEQISTCPPLADPGILGLSVKVLEKYHQLSTDPAASSFRWLSQTYVQWHALAVTIAELCVKTEGPTVERAWAILMPAFKEVSQNVADSSEGMLWRPIKKLMNKAQGLRQEYLDSRSASTNLPAKMVDWNTSAQGSHRADSGPPRLGRTENASHAMEGVLEGVQVGPSVSGFEPFDWDPWLAAASNSMDFRMQSHNHEDQDQDQMAWTNWENFVNGFQGQDGVVL